MADYTKVEQIFHRLILGSSIIQKVSFNFEKEKYLPFCKTELDNPVFILGLPRSGTTTLLRLLYSSGAYNSITYRDMPFVLMPRLWHKMTKNFHTHMKSVERSHSDSILIDYDSPESFESIFWNCFDPSSHHSAHFIQQYEPSLDVIQEFKNHIALTAHKTEEPKRYISKNNNNLIRLESLSQFFPEGRFILLWRNPLQTAYSSYKQHRLFSKLQAKKPFVLTYMNLLSHYEFGLNHKPFIFKQSNINGYLENDPNYWLAYWIDIHQSLLNCRFESNVIFVSYESLCEHPEKNLINLFEKINLQYSKEYEKQLRLSKSYDLPNFDPLLIKLAYDTSSVLRLKSL